MNDRNYGKLDHDKSKQMTFTLRRNASPQLFRRNSAHYLGLTIDSLKHWPLTDSNNTVFPKPSTGSDISKEWKYSRPASLSPQYQNLGLSGRSCAFWNRSKRSKPSYGELNLYEYTLKMVLIVCIYNIDLRLYR